MVPTLPIDLMISEILVTSSVGNLDVLFRLDKITKSTNNVELPLRGVWEERNKVSYYPKFGLKILMGKL